MTISAMIAPIISRNMSRNWTLGVNAMNSWASSAWSQAKPSSQPTLAGERPRAAKSAALIERLQAHQQAFCMTLHR
jgi:hypothetical protein